MESTRLACAVGLSVTCLGAGALGAPFTFKYYEWVGPPVNAWQMRNAIEDTHYTATEVTTDRWSITLLVDQVHWNIYADDPVADSIAGIVATGNRDWVSVIIGDAGGPLPEIQPYQFALSTPLLTDGCQDFGGVSGAMAAKTNLIVIAAGDIAGSASVFEAARLRAGGSFSADVENDAASTEEISVLVVGGFSGSYVSNGASIESFDAGSFTGEVDTSGSLGRLEVSGTPISGEVVCEGIDLALDPGAGILLDGDSFTDVSVDDELPPTTITINGDFGGQIQIDGDLSADSAIIINGTLLSSGKIDIRGEMLADSEIEVGVISGTAVQDGGRIEIRDELRDDAEIGVFGDFAGRMILDDLEGDVTITGAVDATGVVQMDTLALGVVNGLFIGDELAGQVIINQQDDGSTWSGYVWANGYEFQSSEPQPEQAPFYELSSADLGGGAIGLVPYWLHVTDCDPRPGIPAQGSPGSVVLAHYGPVVDASGTGMPFVIEKKPVIQSFPYIDWYGVASDFTVAIDGRVAEIEPKPLHTGFEAGYYYRIMPDEDGGDLLLHCGGVTGDVDVLDYSYLIKVLSRADLSMNGAVDTSDPVLWIADPVDVNEDGVADTNDLEEIFAEME